jgi:hypothetical protein
VSYAGEPFSFEQVKAADAGHDRLVWAVSRRGEFIGTMSTPQEITTKDFDVRSTDWLADLLGKRPHFDSRPRLT